jgi:prepilin-type N-terminal cleavage/methylation domain-containing protein
MKLDFKEKRMNKKQKGFSLIELLIVVAIILIIAAIAIPNLLRSRMAANEASAVGSVRTIVTFHLGRRLRQWSGSSRRRCWMHRVIDHSVLDRPRADDGC